MDATDTTNVGSAFTTSILLKTHVVKVPSTDVKRYFQHKFFNHQRKLSTLNDS